MAHSTLPQMARRAGRLLLAAIFLAGSVSTTWGGLSGGVVFSPETAIAAPAPQSDGGAANSAFVPTVRYEHEDRIFGGLWTTGIQVMNLDPANEAAVELGFYDEWGAQPDGSARTEMVPAGKSRTFFADGLGVPAGFNGSAALKASRPIGVIVNQLAPGRGLAASFNAPAAGASKVYVPSIERGLGGYDSSLYIQNAGSGWIGTIKIEFFKLDEAQPVHTREYKARLAPGA
ncbi:MAG: hypothetical protein HY329_04010, partial [Chloroflexi bacterium]|nr:hypothetical protein [Chloroflexota bacterium]